MNRERAEVWVEGSLGLLGTLLLFAALLVGGMKGG